MNKIGSPLSMKPVAVWIMAGVGMLLIQVILGGITRLTGSGLSITEWNVVAGLVPPLNGQQWIEEFNKYKQTSQYNLLNTHFTLEDFKFIFFWEWVHRLWARLIALAFAIPFIIFLFQKRITKQMIRPLLLLFLFGALQGAIGWIMVKSGLTGDAIYVKPTRLALHFVFALALIVLTFWTGLKWLKPQIVVVEPSLRRITVWIIGLIFLQLMFGALMAGHKAAIAAPTWPTINGSLVPPGLLRDQPPLINFIENKIAIHFVHRGLAYLLFVLIMIWSRKAFKTSSSATYFKRTRILPVIMVSLQLLLGVFAVLSSTGIRPNHWGLFEWVALLHQVEGMLLLLTMFWMLYVLTPKFQTQQL